jgi:hypothetical protein
MPIARRSRGSLAWAGVLATLAVFAFAPAVRAGHSGSKSKGGFCSATAKQQERACAYDTMDNYYTARAICANIGDSAERSACFGDAVETLRDETQECRDQSDARADLCELVGEAPYEPDFDPAHFDDPRSPLTNPNPYMPLGVGDHWTTSSSSGEIDEVEVQNKVKSIAGVLCRVVNDTVYVDGVPTEVTHDWVAQRKDGGVMYCGEETGEYETFPGDDPQEPELVDTEGSFKTGREGAKPGLLFPAAPQVDDSYRQEWSPGNAEDAATVLSTSYSYGHDATLDELVPAALAQLLCSAGDCVVTAEFTPLEPDALERKYYAKGIGNFLVTNPEEGTIEQLVGCNMDARCASLPQP